MASSCDPTNIRVSAGILAAPRGLAHGLEQGPVQRVLLFSHSDAEGRFSGGRGWGTMLGEREAEVALVSVDFFAGAPSSAAYAARKVAEHEPDVIVLPLGTYGFAMEYVELRIRRLLGERAGRLYKRAEVKFDHATRQRDREPRRFNRWARRLLRSTIGAEGAVAQEEYTAHVEETLRAIARFEDSRVVIVTRYPGTGALDSKRTRPRREAFHRRVEAIAGQHRFALIDVGAALAPYGEPKQFFVDLIHLNAAGHALIGPVVQRAVLEDE